MKLVYSWLKDFVDVQATPQELASRLALSTAAASSEAGAWTSGVALGSTGAPALDFERFGIDVVRSRIAAET